MASLDKVKLKTWFAAWARLAGPRELPTPVWASPDDLAGVLNDIRRDDARLTAAFELFANGAAVLQRVRQVIACEATGATLPYVVPRPLAATDDELMALVREALERSHALGCKDIPLDVAIAVVRRPLTPEEHAHTAPLTEALDDDYVWLRSSIPRRDRTAIHFLSEAVYALTAFMPVRDYILTPLHFARTQSVDAYAPQFELWKRGAQALVTQPPLDEGVTVFVSSEGQG